MFFKKKPTYIIYSWPYSEEVGGFVALHNLCNHLRKVGREAYIWPAGLPTPSTADSKNWLSLPFNRRKPLNVNFRLNQNFDTSVAALEDLKNSIVIYPEVVAGNPLNAKRIVRWFLNKPGLLTGEIKFTENELCFYYQEAFDDPTLNPNSNNKLQLITVLDDVFKQTKPIEGRRGTCYILRKGKDRAPQADELDGPTIDNRSHQEIAEIFNNHEYCVSYDTHTMYSFYAAMCGCKTVIVPEPGVTKSEWQPIIELTYGRAYGHSDLEWAMQTRELMIEHYQHIQSENLKSVSDFALKCEQHFKI